MELYTVGDFYEVFDTINKETVYASASITSAREVIELLEIGLEVPKYLTQLN